MSSNWSHSEKKIARRVYDSALQSELAEVMRSFKAMAGSAKEPADMWAVEEFLVQARRAIDGKYDYRYSQLEFVFGILLREGRISASDLAGLSEDKVSRIVGMASL